VNPPNERALVKKEGGGASLGQGMVGPYAGNHIVFADRGRIVAVNIGGIVAAVTVSGSSGGLEDVNARVLA
jgi:hypothetical protein